MINLFVLFFWDEDIPKCPPEFIWLFMQT